MGIKVGAAMGGSSLSAVCADAIRRYRRSSRARRAAGACRFDPTCSSYALEAFETRALPIALAMTASRLLRCNPLVRRVTPDAVCRRDRGLRPGALRTASVLLALAGVGTLFVLSGIAAADVPTGGCSGSANRRPAASLTQDNPLKVKEHDTISAQGKTPPGKSGPNQTHVEVFLIDSIGGVTSKDHAGDGDTWSSTTVEVDDYLKYGVGIYKVEVTNTGEGWKCTFVGYIELDGNPLTKPVGLAAAAMTAVGAVGGVLARRRAKSPRWEQQQIQSASADRVPEASAQPDVRDRGIEQVDMALEGQPGCLFSAVAALSLSLAAMPVFGTGGGAGAVTVPRGRVLWSKRVWRRGHPIVGFISGFLFGAGVTVLLQQYNVWLLTVVTAIFVPLAAGVLIGLFAWIGRPYRIVARARIEEPAPPAPATPVSAATAESATEDAAPYAPVVPEPPPVVTPTESPSEPEGLAWRPDPDEPPPPPPAT